jgi:hypothetical protein
MLVITNGFSWRFEVRKYSGFPIWSQEALPYTLGHWSFGLAWRSDVYSKLFSESVTTVICPKLMLKSEIWFQCSDGEMWWDCWLVSRLWISLPFNKLMQSFIIIIIIIIHMCIQGLGNFFPLPLPPPLPPTLPPPSPPTPSIPSRNYFALISNFVVERV